MDDLLSVGEVARRSGVAVSALHFYESKGLIESARTAGNQRRYARDVLRRVAVIKVAQRAGIPLTEIREALAGLPQRRTVTAGTGRCCRNAGRAISTSVSCASRNCATNSASASAAAAFRFAAVRCATRTTSPAKRGLARDSSSPGPNESGRRSWFGGFAA